MKIASFFEKTNNFGINQPVKPFIPEDYSDSQAFALSQQISDSENNLTDSNNGN